MEYIKNIEGRVAGLGNIYTLHICFLNIFHIFPLCFLNYGVKQASNTQLDPQGLSSKTTANESHMPAIIFDP